MAHELLFQPDGRASIIYVGDTPWHGFGTKVAAVSAMEAVEMVGSDYQIVKEQNVCRNPDGKVVAVDGYTLWCPPLHMYGLHTAQEFGQVGKDYVPIHTVDIAASLDQKNDDGQSVTDRWPVVTHGIVSGGTRVFFSLDGGEFEVMGSPVRLFVNLRDNKKGNGAFDISVGGTRIVCRNTFDGAGTSALITANIRHTGEAKTEVHERLLLIAQAQEAMAKMTAECQRMAETRLGVEDIKHLLAATYPTKKPTPRFELAKQLQSLGDKGGETFRRIHGADLKDYLAARENDDDGIMVYRAGVLTAYKQYNDHDQNEAHGTAWAYFNAVTGYIDHDQVIRGSDASRAVYKAFGKGSDAKVRAYEACTALN